MGGKSSEDRKVVLLMPNKNENVYIFGHCWMPENSIKS